MAISYYSFYRENEGFLDQLQYADLSLDLTTATAEEKKRNLLTWVHEHIKTWADSLAGNHQCGYRDLAYVSHIGPLNDGFHIPMYPHHTGMNAQFLGFDECNTNGHTRVPMGMYDQGAAVSSEYKSGFMGFYLHKDTYTNWQGGVLCPAHVNGSVSWRVAGSGDRETYAEASVSQTTTSTDHWYVIDDSDTRFAVSIKKNLHYDEGNAPYISYDQNDSDRMYQDWTDTPPDLGILTCNDIGGEYFLIIGKDGGSGIVSTPEAYLPAQSKSNMGWQFIIGNNDDAYRYSGGNWTLGNRRGARGIHHPHNMVRGSEFSPRLSETFFYDEFNESWTSQVPQFGHWQAHTRDADWYTGGNNYGIIDMVAEEYTYGIPGGIHAYPRGDYNRVTSSVSAAKLANSMPGIVAGGNKVYCGNEVRAYVNDNILFISGQSLINSTDQAKHIRYNNKTYWNAMGNIWVRVA